MTCHGVRFFLTGKFRCHPFAKHSENQFKIIPMIAQILVRGLQALVGLVCRWRRAECRFADFGGQNGKIPIFRNTTFLPFIRQVLADGDSTQTLVDPVFRLSLLFVKLLHTVLSQFRIFDFQYPVAADLSQPLFERFRFRRGN